MRHGEPNIYGGICTARNMTQQILWSGMQAYLVFNAVALPLAFGSSESELVKLLVSGFGCFMHLGLVFGTRYLTRLLGFWDERLYELEQLDHGSEDGLRVAVFSHPDFWTHQEWPRLQTYFIPFLLGMFVWTYEVLAHSGLFTR